MVVPSVAASVAVMHPGALAQAAVLSDKTPAAVLADTTPVVIAPTAAASSTLLSPSAVPPTVGPHPAAPSIAVPSSSDRDEAVRMADAMIALSDNDGAEQGLGGEAQPSAGSRTGADEVVDSAQVGPSAGRFQPGYHLSCLVSWAAKHAPEEDIARLLRKSDTSFLNDMASVFYTSVSKVLSVRERIKELERRDAETEALRAEAEALRGEAASFQLERDELHQQLEDGKARELHLQEAMSRLEAEGFRLQGVVKDLEGRNNAATAELTRARAYADTLAGENTRLGELLERTKVEAAKEMSRAVAQAKEASLATTVAAAVTAYKTSKERDAEAAKFFNRGFDECLVAVQNLYPDLDLDPLLPKDDAEDAALATHPNKATDSQVPPTV